MPNSMPLWARHADFGTDGDFVAVNVFRATGDDPKSILVGFGKTDDFQVTALDRDMAMRLRDLLDAALDADIAVGNRRKPQVIVEGPGDATDYSDVKFWEPVSAPDDLSDDGEALASAGWGTDEDYGG
jgi:hypothetical protein